MQPTRACITCKAYPTLGTCNTIRRNDPVGANIYSLSGAIADTTAVRSNKSRSRNNRLCAPLAARCWCYRLPLTRVLHAAPRACRQNDAGGD